MPTIVICPKVKNLKTISIGKDASISNDVFLKQFHWLGQNLNISFTWFPKKKWSGNLTLGNNLG